MGGANWHRAAKFEMSEGKVSTPRKPDDAPSLLHVCGMPCQASRE